MSAKHIVCLTFDFDAISGFIARGQTSPSWDLSPHSIGLLLKHGFLYDSSLDDARTRDPDRRRQRRGVPHHGGGGAGISAACGKARAC
jgi:hypothetical protein